MTGCPWRCMLTGMFFMCAVSVLHGQYRRTGADTDVFDEMNKIGDRNVPVSVQLPAVALESAIDPDHYFVGPSDVFSVNVWVSPPVSLLLTVTPEGTLIIPMVGELNVTDLTLAEAKRRVIAEIRKKYRVGEATLTLVNPRPIVVIVTGNVLNPGSYVMKSIDRADKAVEQANVVQRTQAQSDAQYTAATMSRRNITISHKDGNMSRVDIVKYFATKEDRWNPYLREGDVIVVPRNDFTKNVIGIYGEVVSPGRFEYVAGDSIKDALRIAHGFTPFSIQDSVELSRLNEEGSRLTRTLLDGGAIFRGEHGDAALQPGDRIIVRSRPDMRADYRVTVSGEVTYPGIYPLTKKHTRLSEVIFQAGGFTSYASIKNAELLRRSVGPADIELERLESLRGGVAADDSAYYYLETNLRIQKEIVNVDFAKLFVEGDTSQDIIVQNDDYVVVPSLNHTIYVFGQVVSPGHISYVPGMNADYYIRRAGGFTDRARDGDVKIVKSKTRQWLSPGETIVEEGDYVWVPKVPEHPFGYYLNIIGQTAAIVSVAVSIVLLTIQTSK
jgi:protein involved in polysaccharide export with SLBB domain